MEITNERTISTDEISTTSNKYLADIEVWDERDLPFYKKKVKDRIIGGYSSIILGIVIAYIFYTAVMTIALSAFNKGLETMQAIPAIQWGLLALSCLAVFLIIFKTAKKSMIEFIDSCHGEIAHDGQPFAKKLKGNLVFSIILFIAGCAAIIYFGGIKVTETGLSVFDSFMFAPALIAPLAYFWGSLNVRYELSICPICGRMNTVYRIKSSKDFGEKNDGSHEEHEYRSERVGTRTTTTYYSDGSKESTSSGIYESVRYTKEYDDYSNLAKYTYLCKECSYAEETVEEKRWKVLRSEHRG